jgi:homoserine O-acetyltransferase
VTQFLRHENSHQNKTETSQGVSVKKVIAGALWMFVFFGGYAASSQIQETPKDGTQQFAALGEFKLQSGAVLHDFHLGYRIFGKLNSEKSNAVLWPTWLGGKTEDLVQFIGPGKVVDSSKYFVILVDAIGNGISTSPSNSKSQPLMKFPNFSIRDMVESQYRFLTEALHVKHLHAVMGISMGGMQTFEWAVAYPDFMDLTIPLVGSPQSTSYDKLLWTAQIDALKLDPAWNNGNPAGTFTKGVILSEEIGSMNLTTPAYRVAQTKPDEFEKLQSEIRKESRSDPGAVCDQIRQREAIINHDIYREFGIPLAEVVKRLHSKMLVIVSWQDHMVNPAPAVDFGRALGAPIVELESPCGHISTACVSLGPTVASFLDNPASAHSETLRESTKK